MQIRALTQNFQASESRQKAVRQLVLFAHNSDKRLQQESPRHNRHARRRKSVRFAWRKKPAADPKRFFKIAISKVKQRFWSLRRQATANGAKASVYLSTAASRSKLRFLIIFIFIKMD